MGANFVHSFPVILSVANEVEKSSLGHFRFEYLVGIIYFGPHQQTKAR